MIIWFDEQNKNRFFFVKINTKKEHDMSLVLNGYMYCILLSLECLKSSCHLSLQTLNRAHLLYAHDWHSKSMMCATLHNSMSAYWTQKMPPSFMQFLYNGGKKRYFFCINLYRLQYHCIFQSVWGIEKLEFREARRDICSSKNVYWAELCHI